MFAIFSLSSNFDLYDLLRDIDLFDSSLKHSDSNLRHFNEASNFLRNLNHCQHLYRYRKTHLLLFLLNCLNDSIFKWLQKQTHFDSLHIFSTTLANAFSSQQQRREIRARRRANRKVAKRIVEDAKSTSKLQNIDIFDSHTCNESEFELYDEVASFLQSLQQCQHQYRKSNLLNLLSKCLCDFAFEWFKTQSEFISLKRFDRALTKAFSKASIRRVSRSSNLQLSILDVVSESTESAFDFEVTCVRVTCKLCKQNFNFNNELYEHIRNHEASKFVKNSYLSINAVNLVCEIKKTSFASHKSFASFAIQKSINESASTFRIVTLLKRSSLSSSTLEARSESTERSTTCRHCDETFNFKKSLREHKSEQHSKMHVKNSRLEINAVESLCATKKKSTVMKSFDSSELQASIATSEQIFESVFILKTIISQESTHFSVHTSKNVSESKKNKSTRCFATSLKSSSSQTFESKHQKISIQKSSIINASLSIDTVDLVYETMKKSIIELSLFASFDIFNSVRSHQNSKKRRFNQIIIFIQHLQQCQHLYDESELLEWMKVILCDFVDIWFENQSNFIFLHDFDIVLTKTFSERSNLSLFTLKIESESTKRSATCRHCKQTFKFKELFRKHKREQHAKKSVINSSLRFHALKSVCKAKKKSVVKNVMTLFASQELQTRALKSQKIDVQKSSVISSSLSTTTINSTCKVAKKSTITSIAKVSKITSEQRVEWRFRTAYLSTRLKASRLSLSLNTFVIISETMKNASIQEVACARAMCKSCKQNFNFNNELFEHIREHETLKRINDFHLSINTVKAACEFVQKSINTCSSSSYESLIFTTSRNLISSTKTSLQSVSSKCSSLQLRVFNSASKSTKSISVQRIFCVRTICKRCKQNFNFNNKLHEHIRQYHARKSVKNSDFRVFTSESTYKIVEKSAVSCSINSQFASSIFFATSRSQMFSVENASRSVSSNDSHFSITTSKIISKSMKKLSANCSLTFSISSSQTSIRKHQKSHNEFYLIVNDLSRMFHEKFKSFDLRQHHNRCSSSQSFDIRQSHFSFFSIKSHLTIENLFEMFDEKFKRKNLFQNQKNVSSQAFSNQMRIISYFQSTINRKSSISQNSKNSKSKSLNQHMSAKSIRIVFSKDFSEKSIDLSYKLSVVFCHLKSSKPRTSAETSFFIFMLLRLLPTFLIALAFVSAISAARMDCINVYGQAVSTIGRIIQ